MKTARSRGRFAALLVVAAVLLARPARRPLKTCGHCGTSNESERTSCIGCGRRF